MPVTQVVRSLRLALSGEDAGLLQLDEEVEPVAIRLELPRAERSSASDLGQVYLASAKTVAADLVPMRGFHLGSR